MTKSDINEFPVPAVKRTKFNGMDFYTKVLGSSKLVVAPMVDQSELAWRLLSRRHGAQLCYSPMFHSNIFCKDPKYRKEALISCPEDRPLIIQFCGNDPTTILDAALLAQDHCDAIDINLGCPQAIAKRGHYGAFLQDEWDLLGKIVNLLHKNLLVPVTCKIRVFEDKAKTIKYAKMLEQSGCQLLTVHGRTRDQKGPFTGLADWTYIRDVKQNVKIPVFSNGNINSIEDINRCIEFTKCDGVMTAEGNLHNPALFEGCSPVTWEIANEYLDIVEKYPSPCSYIRGHLFKIFHHLLNTNFNSVEREGIATAHTLIEFRKMVKQLEEKFTPYHEGKMLYDEKLLYGPDKEPTYDLSLPPWLCQSYIRPPPAVHIQRIQEKIRQNEDPTIIKPKFFDADGNEISRKQMKKQRRISRRPEKSEGKHDRTGELCGSCSNPLGIKCGFKMCKKCCRSYCYTDNLDCIGHRILIRTKREFAKNQLETHIVPTKLLKLDTNLKTNDNDNNNSS